MCFRAAILLSISLAGCGDALVGAEFKGRPLFQMSGPIVQVNARVPTSHGAVRLAVFWAGSTPNQELNLNQEQSADLESQLAAYRMQLFDEPAADATTLSNLVEKPEGRLGIGVVVLYAERDGIQGYSPATDFLLGATEDHLIAWSATDVAPDTGAHRLLGPMKSGFALYRYESPASCPFLSVNQCEGSGELTQVSLESEVTLTLIGEPAGVLVPSPLLDPQGTIRDSIWSIP